MGRLVGPPPVESGNWLLVGEAWLWGGLVGGGTNMDSLDNQTCTVFKMLSARGMWYWVGRGKVCFSDFLC